MTAATPQSELPVLFVTGHAPPERVAPFALLAARERVEFALFGGRALHAVGGVAAPDFPHRSIRQREARRLAASGRYRAVICGTGGRVALPGSYAGARRARVPFVLWASLWSHPRSLTGAAGLLPLRAIYRGADAVVTYGPHVTRYVAALGARSTHEAPQAVDNAFWSSPVDMKGQRRAAFEALFVGRPDRQKGLAVLLAAWRAAKLDEHDARLVLAGVAAHELPADAPSGVVAAATQDPFGMRNFYALADVLVMPSVPTRTVRETWGLAANEAMCQATPVIASDAVGAAAGGLVRHEQTGLVVPAGDVAGLAWALGRLEREPATRAMLGAAAQQAVRAYTFDAWTDGFGAALAEVGAAANAPRAAASRGLLA